MEAIISFLKEIAPKELGYISAFLLLVILLWPRILQIAQFLSPKHRAYERKRKDLELVKLEYEILQIQKIENMDDDNLANHFAEIEKREKPSDLYEPQNLPPDMDYLIYRKISVAQRFIVAIMGASLAIMLPLGNMISYWRAIPESVNDVEISSGILLILAFLVSVWVTVTTRLPHLVFYLFISFSIPGIIIGLMTGTVFIQ